MRYFVPQPDMFAWQDEVPAFSSVSVEDSTVAAQDSEAVFLGDTVAYV